jgi:TRAP-type C4-dicarboxylate transport system permease small subunit
MGSTVRRFNDIFDRILDGTVFFAGVWVFWQTFSVSINTLLRYFFNSPISGIDNIAEYGILWIAFLSAAWLLKTDRHIKADIIISRLSAKVQAILELLCTLISIMLCLIMLYYSILVTIDLWLTHETDPFKIRGLPRAIPVSIIPFGFLLLTIQFIRKCFLDIARLRDPGRKPASKDVTANEEVY